MTIIIGSLLVRAARVERVARAARVARVARVARAAKVARERRAAKGPKEERGPVKGMTSAATVVRLVIGPVIAQPMPFCITVHVLHAPRRANKSRQK